MYIYMKSSNIQNISVYVILIKITRNVYVKVRNDINSHSLNNFTRESRALFVSNYSRLQYNSKIQKFPRVETLVKRKIV